MFGVIAMHRQQNRQQIGVEKDVPKATLILCASGDTALPTAQTFGLRTPALFGPKGAEINVHV